MAGDNQLIHGYNKVLQDQFEMKPGSKPVPKNFELRLVEVKNGQRRYDHQGHIVPQHMLNKVLNPLMQEMYSCENEEKVLAYISKSPYQQWLQLVFDYGIAIGAPIFMFTESDPELRLGGFFSIVTWNPANICRAPDDASRGEYPKEGIDQKVVDYLTRHPNEAASAEWLREVSTIAASASPTKEEIAAYIRECSIMLQKLIVKEAGYYAFPWIADGKGFLLPVQ